MLVHFEQANKRTATTAFTLVELLVTLAIFGGATGGLIYGYVQVNRLAEWGAMSLAAQSIASQGAEQARCAKWDTLTSSTNVGRGTGDELGLTNYSKSGPDYTLDIPTSGDPVYVTNNVFITTNNSTAMSSTVKLRQIRSECVWRFPLTGDLFTNTVVTVRAPDQ